MSSNDSINEQFKDSFKWVFIERIAYMSIQFVSTVILTRLVLPSDFGIMGMTAIFMALASLFVDSGLGSAIIKKDSPTDLDFSTLFIFNLVSSFILYVILFIISPLISEFYAIPEITPVIRISAISILFYSVGIVNFTILTRQLKFRMQAIITLFSFAAASVVSICIAYIGFGIWALVLQQVLYSAFQTISALIFCRHKITWRFSYDSLINQIRFGSSLVGSSIIAIVFDNIYAAAIGKLFGAVETGLYYQAKRVQSIPVTFFSVFMDKATFPILAKVNDKGEFRGYTSELVSRSLFAIIPIMSIVSLLSKDIILILLGKNWIDADWILSSLSIAGIGLGLESVTRNIIKATGKTESILKLELIKKVLATFILIVSLFGGFKTLITGIFVTSILYGFTNLIAIYKINGVSLSQEFKKTIPIILLSIICYIIVFAFLHSNILKFSPGGRMITVIILYSLLYYLGSFVLKLPELRYFLSIINGILKIKSR